MRARRPDCERELRQLLRAPALHSHDVAEFITSHERELTEQGVGDLHGAADEVVARLRCFINRRDEGRRQKSLRNLIDRATDLRKESRWTGDRIAVVPSTFFRLVSAARAKQLRFVSRELDVSMSRTLVARAGMAVRPFNDVTVHIDQRGIRISWRGGRGQLALRPQPPSATSALTIALASKRPQASGPALLAAVIADLGFDP